MSSIVQWTELTPGELQLAHEVIKDALSCMAHNNPEAIPLSRVASCLGGEWRRRTRVTIKNATHGTGRARTPRKVK